MAPTNESPSIGETTQLLQEWETEIRDTSGSTDSSQDRNDINERLIHILNQLADVVEKEMDNYFKQDPDPFDDRHPARADPDCAIGNILKTLFKKEEFMAKLVGQYILDSCPILSTATARLLLDIMPGSETSAAGVFQGADSLLQKLFSWAISDEEPASLYAVGLLARAMDNQDIAAAYRDKNNLLVPVLLKKLHNYRKEKNGLEDNGAESSGSQDLLSRPFVEFAKDGLVNGNGGHASGSQQSVTPTKNDNCFDTVRSRVMRSPIHFSLDSPNLSPRPTRRPSSPFPPSINNFNDAAFAKCGVEPLIVPGYDHEHTLKNGQGSRQSGLMVSLEPAIGSRSVQSLDSNSNSSWAEMERFVIGSYRLSPLSTEMKERLIVLYLTTMGEYQELLAQVFEHNALSLILQYINLKENNDVCLAFEALKYLGSLLCHKKFAIEFLNVGGVQVLLRIPRPSMAATGVSMCLYYLSYFEDAMERVCLLPNSVLSEMVTFCLWLLECSHESGRCHATMFFSASFQFRVILELYDAQGGLRTLTNVATTLGLMEDSVDLLTEDELYSRRQLLRNVAVAFRRYFEAHLCIMSDNIRRSTARLEGTPPPLLSSAYKSQGILSASELMENLEMLLEMMPISVQWEPVSTFLKLGGVPLVLKYIAYCGESNYNGRSETVRSLLDVLTIGAVVPKVQIRISEAVKLTDNQRAPGMNIILSAAHGEIVEEAAVRISALHCVNMCVSGPKNRLPGTSGRYSLSGPSVRRKTPNKPEWGSEQVLVKMWETVRSNNGIMVLLTLLATKTPVTDADLIRTLACRALVGLARHDRVQQIISKLPLFNNGQLQTLMREPILHDKRLEHAKFCKHATELLERVTGKSQTANIDASIDRIRKADAVAQTKIVYHEKELLQLIHQHLNDKGYLEAADALQNEANLLSKVMTPMMGPPLGPPVGLPVTPMSKRHNHFNYTPTQTSHRNTLAASTSSSSYLSPTNPSANKKTKWTPKSSPKIPTPIFRQKAPVGAPCHLPSPVLRKLQFQPRSLQMSKPSVSLDSIVTDYLRKQHAICRNPVVICPPFSLLTPHNCPEPRHKRSAPSSITARILNRSASPQFGGLNGRSLDRKLIHSKFRPVRTYRDTEQDGTFTSVAFSQCQQWLMFGTYAGELKLYNIDAATEYMSKDCHDAAISSIQQSRDGRLVLTSSPYGQVMSSLWKVNEVTRGDPQDFMNQKWTWDSDNYMEFSKSVQDRVVGTQLEAAHVYDINTGQRLLQLVDRNISNNYTKNKATFNSTDDLILNDGILWDVRSGKVIHKFDKFNPHISGLFHPNDLEIIINSEVWDMKTFHLLRTVPALDQCHIRFTTCGDIIYGANPQSDDDMDDDQHNSITSQFGSSFRTFDASTYENIATIDVKKQIVDLCIDHTDGFLAIIENQRNTDSFSEESLCRLYEVGRVKAAEEENPDEEEEEEDEEDDDDDDDDNDDDDEEDDDGDNDDVGGNQVGGDLVPAEGVVNEDDGEGDIVEVGRVEFEDEDDEIIDMDASAEILSLSSEDNDDDAESEASSPREPSDNEDDDVLYALN